MFRPHEPAAYQRVRSRRVALDGSGPIERCRAGEGVTDTARFAAGERVIVRRVDAYRDYIGTVTGPATQAGMDVVVELDGVGLVEFRHWEVQGL